MSMTKRMARLTELLLTLFDPRTDEGVAADLVSGMSEEMLREVCMVACTWVAQGLAADSIRDGVSTDAIMEHVRLSLEQGAAEFDRLDHEGGLFT